MSTTIPFADLSYGTDMSQDYKGRRIDFDEGYSQRAKRMNGAPQQWRMVWEGIPDEVAEELRQFFEAKQGSGLIRWTPFNQAAGLVWTASQWTSRPAGYRTHNCSVVLSQEFDLTGPSPGLTLSPAISGVLQVGEELTASTGTWTGDPERFFWQFFRNEVAVTDPTNSPRFLTSPADDGADLEVEVTAVNVGGEAVARSAKVKIASAPVVAPAPTLDNVRANSDNVRANRDPIRDALANVEQQLVTLGA